LVFTWILLCYSILENRRKRKGKADLDKLLEEERATGAAGREEILLYKLEIQNLEDEKRRLLEAQSAPLEPCPGCKRRDDMVADRDYSALFVLLKDSQAIQTDYSKLKLPPDSTPLSNYSFPDSKESWDYVTRKKALLRDEVLGLAMRAEYFCKALGVSDSEFLLPTKNSGIILDELQRSLAKFEMKVHSTLDILKPRLTQEFARVPAYREPPS
jgi:hypothetical protein